MFKILILILINIISVGACLSNDKEKWYSIEGHKLTQKKTPLELVGKSFNIASYTYEPQSEPIASVTTVHGYLVNCHYLKPIHEVLLQNGYQVTCIEMPGLGQSDGKRADVPSFKTYKDFISKLKLIAPNSKYLVAHSTAAVGIFDHVFSNEALGYSHILLVAPLVRNYNFYFSKTAYYLGRYFMDGVSRDPSSAKYKNEALNIIHRKDPHWVSEIPVTWVGKYLDWNSEIEKTTKTYPTKNMTIVYGGDDKVVDTDFNSSFLKERLPNASHITYQGASHYPFWDTEVKDDFNQLMLKVFQSL